MIRKKRKHRMVLDLTGPEGNAFCILGYAKSLAKTLDRPWEPIRKRMTSGDYENLIKVFDKEFGDYVIMER